MRDERCPALQEGSQSFEFSGSYRPGQRNISKDGAEMLLINRAESRR